MPRLAPVTSATLPASGAASPRPGRRPGRRGRRSGRPGRTRTPTWGRAGSRACSSPRPRRPRRRRRAATVPPRPISLPRLRVKPSSARWATRASPSSSSGGVPMTTARGQVARLRISGVKKSCSRAELGRGGDAGGVEDQALEPRAFLGRGVDVVRRGDAERRRGGPGATRPAGRVPPTTTVPSTSGAPGAYRSSCGGLGEAEVGGEELADRGGGEGLVLVAHGVHCNCSV